MGDGALHWKRIRPMGVPGRSSFPPFFFSFFFLCGGEIPPSADTKNETESNNTTTQKVKTDVGPDNRLSLFLSLFFYFFFFLYFFFCFETPKFTDGGTKTLLSKIGSKMFLRFVNYRVGS